MIFGRLADLVMLLHFGFIVFSVVGGLLVMAWPWVAWVHIPTFVWVGTIGFLGWPCPLTYIERNLDQRAGREPREADFVEHFFMPFLYPKWLFPGGYPNHSFLYIALLVLVLNLVVYGAIICEFEWSGE